MSTRQLLLEAGTESMGVCVWNKESNVCFVLCKASTAPLGYKILPLFCLCYKYTKKIEANTPCLFKHAPDKKGRTNPKATQSMPPPAPVFVLCLNRNEKTMMEKNSIGKKTNVKVTDKAKAKTESNRGADVCGNKFRCFNTRTLHMVRL